MLPTFDELKADPNFIKLSYGEQLNVRAELFRRKAATTPGFAALSPQAKQAAAEKYVYTAPVLEQQAPSGYMQKAASVVQRMQQGDARAVKEAADLAAWRSGTKAMLMPTLLAQGKDAVAKLFDPTSEKDGLYHDYYGADGDKIGQWLEANVAKYGGEGAAQQMNIGAGAIAGVGNIAEFLLSAVATGGATTGTFAATAAGKALAMSKPFIGSRAITSIAPTLAASAVATTSMTLMDVGRRVLQQDLIKEQGQFWNKIANDFGQNFAWDIIGWGLAKSAGTLMKAIVKTGKGFQPTPAGTVAERLASVDDATLQDAFKTFTSEQHMLKTMSPGAWKRYAQDEATMRVKHIDPKGELGFAIGARSTGYETKFNADGSVDFMHATDSGLNFHAANRKSAALSLAELLATGNAATAAPSQIMKKVVAAADGSSRLMRTTVSKLADEMPIDAAAKLVIPQQGVYQADAIQVFARQYLRKAGVAEGVVQKVRVALDDAAQTKGDMLVLSLPRTATSLQVEKEFQLALKEQLEHIVITTGKKVDNTLQDTFAMLQRAHIEAPQSFTSLHILGDKLKYKVTELGQGRVQLESAAGKQQFPNLLQAQGQMLDEAMRKGLVDDAQVASAIQARTGYELRKQVVDVVPGKAAKVLASAEMRDAQEVHYTLGKPVGGAYKQLASANSVGELIAARPELDFKLPTALAPSSFVVDGTAKTITIQENVALGTSDQLLEMVGHFQTTQNVGQTIFAGDAKKVLKVDSGTFKVINEALGVEVELGNAAAAMKKMRQWDNSYTAHKDALAMKGFQMTSLPDGSLAVYNAEGIAQRFKSLHEMRVWQKQHPMPSWQKEMMPVADDATKEATKQAVEATAATQKHKWLKAMQVKVSTFISPSEATLVQMAKRTGNPHFLRRWREGKGGYALVEAANAKAGAVLHQVFAKTSRNDRVILGSVMQRPRQEWEQFAAKVYDYRLSADDIGMMEKLQQFYDEAFKAAGIEDWKKQLNYLPRIKQWVLENGDEVMDSASAQELLQRAFPGAVPSGFNFFGENLRATDIAHMALLEDPMDQAISYVYALNKKKFMDPIVRQMEKDLKNVDLLQGYNEAEVQFMADTLNTMKGITRTPAEGIWRETSKSLAMQLQSIMRKMPGLRNSAIADEAFVGDIFDIANRQMTLSTQASPWAMIRNIPQLTLLGGALRNNKLVMQSFKEVIDEPATATVQRVIKTGVVQDSLFSHGIQQGSKISVWHRMMKWNENMDILTRSTAFKAAEHLVDDNLLRMQKGVLTREQFIKEAQLSIMDADAQKQVMDAIDRGDTGMAKHMYGDYLQRLCFFDYSSMQKPLLGRGVMGKAFGKFMTYPAGTLALYHRIITSGTGSERIARAANIILTSVATYEAFKAVGIDYQGFLWSDPFGFSGGPLWSVLADGSKILDSGPEAAMARKSLLQVLPKMLSPNFAMLQRVQKSMAFLDKGDMLSAGYALGGAPVRRDALWAQR